MGAGTPSGPASPKGPTRWRIVATGGKRDLAKPADVRLEVVFVAEKGLTGHVEYRDVKDPADETLLRLYLEDDAGSMRFYFEDVGWVGGPHDRDLRLLDRAMTALEAHIPGLRAIPGEGAP